MTNLERLELTQEQLKATKAVFTAIKKANKLGVSFWDNYGSLQAFNNKKMDLPTPFGGEFSLNELDPTYTEILPMGAFYSGNADDELFFNEK